MTSNYFMPQSYRPQSPQMAQSPNGFAGYGSAYPQQMQPSAPSSPINRVQGEEAAKAYIVAAGCSVWLMDSEKPVFYIKSADASGIPMPLRVFDYAERGAQAAQQTQIDTDRYATTDQLKSIVERIEAIERGMVSHGEPVV